MTLVPVYPFDCQDSGSARAFHECARIAADLADKALSPFQANSVLVVRVIEGHRCASTASSSSRSIWLPAAPDNQLHAPAY